jgi:single-strand DNA-binding protein
MNKVILVGNLTRDPELSTTSGGVSLCKFGIAVQRRFANAEGNRDVDFFNIIVWRGLAETCHKFLRKGSKAGVVGSIQTRSYEDKDGVKKFVTEIIADEVEFLSSKPASDGYDDGKDVSAELKPVEDDDLPF